LSYCLTNLVAVKFNPGKHVVVYNHTSSCATFEMHTFARVFMRYFLLPWPLKMCFRVITLNSFEQRRSFRSYLPQKFLIAKRNMRCTSFIACVSKWTPKHT